MRTLINELGRALRLAPIEVRARWHSWRLDRSHAAKAHHEDALAHELASARRLLAAR